MNRTRKAWVSAALMALIAPAAVVATLSGPASADADGKHRHDLDTYKREAWVEILGTQSVHQHLSCDVNDIALDGMWKVDAHDGDDREVKATRSHRDTAINMWHYELTNLATGRAQVKLFVTCLDTTTGERDDHAHTLGTPTLAMAGTPTVVGSDWTMTATCSGTDIPVSPGFAVNGGYARLTQSWPVTDTSWQFKFRAETALSGIDAGVWCLPRTTSTVNGHSHLIDADLRPRPVSPAAFGVTETVPVNATGYSDFRIESRPHDEGNVGAFKIDSPDYIWYLGQDAQGQVRGFRFNNTGGGATGQTVTLAVWGFDKRTTRS